MTRIKIDPIQREAITTKTFDAMWLTSLVVLTPIPGQEGRIAIEWQPMAIDGELYPQINRIECDSLFSAVQEVPALAKAFGAIMKAVLPLKEFVETPSPEDDPPIDKPS